MPSVSLDMGILVPPRDPATVRKYVVNLLAWKKLLQEPWVAGYLGEKTSEVLFAEQLYPFRPTLNQMLRDGNIVEYDANTVARVIDAILANTPSVEAVCAIKEILISECTGNPDLLSIYALGPLVAELQRAAVLLAIVQDHCHASSNHILAVSRWPQPPDVQIRTLIHDIEHSREDLGGLSLAPEPFLSCIKVFEAPIDFVLSINVRSIWEAHENAMGLRAALKMLLLRSRIQRGLRSDWEDEPTFQFGRVFLQTLRAITCNQPQGFFNSVMRALVETIDGLSLVDVHKMRSGHGANDPPLMRGRDQAWRRDIDHEYHLHYWQCENGRIEFANVVAHNDYSVPE